MLLKFKRLASSSQAQIAAIVLIFGGAITNIVGMTLSVVAIQAIGLAVGASFTALFSVSKDWEKQSLAERLDSERIRILTTSNGSLLSLVRDIEDMCLASQADKDKTLGKVRQSAVDKIRDMVSDPSPRAAYFAIDDTTQGTVIMKSVARAGSGRIDEFSSMFALDSDTDTNVWKLIRHEGSVQQASDLPHDAPEGFDLSAKRKYKSFVSVAVNPGSLPYGMLTVNSLEPNAFDSLDIAGLKIIARLLGIAETIAKTSSGFRKYSQFINQSGLDLDK
jgi:transcriptional regulator with GAF, ATPase, and Fis domain